MSGVVGVVGKTGVNQLLYDALTVLQHRGQDAAGIMTSDIRRLYLRKANGLVRDVFQHRHMLRLRGNMGIGHVRYPNKKALKVSEAQPFYVNSPYGIALAQSGAVTNARALKEELFAKDRRHVNTGSDAEIMLNVLANGLDKHAELPFTPEKAFKAVEEVYARCKGAYAAVALISGQGVLAFRDPHGIRPLVYGVQETENGNEYMVASESITLDVLRFKRLRDVSPGEAIFIDASGNLHRRQCVPAQSLSPCIFEYVYLARPDSVIDEISVYKSRLRMGQKLGRRIREEWSDLDIDVVIPVPDTARTIAMPLAHELNLKYREGFVKNRYIGRTFIMPGQEQRERSVRRKLNVIDLEFHNKNVLLVDDSIVRGTTCEGIIQMARNAGAKNVYFVSAAPPVRYPNVYGIDMPSTSELVAHGRTVEEIAQTLGVDRLMFQRLEDLIDACRDGFPLVSSFECSVFTGEYITGDIDDAYLEEMDAHSREDDDDENDVEADDDDDIHNVSEDDCLNLEGNGDG